MEAVFDKFIKHSTPRRGTPLPFVKEDLIKPQDQSVDRCIASTDDGACELERRQAQIRDQINSPVRGFAAAFRYARADYSRPTSVIKTAAGKLTANVNDIHEEFHQAWSKVYNRLDGCEPNYADFRTRFMTNIKPMTCPANLPTADQLHAARIETPTHPPYATGD